VDALHTSRNRGLARRQAGWRHDELPSSGRTYVMEYTERILIGMGSQIPVTQARTQLADLVNRVAYAGERIELTRHGKVVAALVSAADYDHLEDASPARPLGFVAGNDPAPAAILALDDRRDTQLSWRCRFCRRTSPVRVRLVRRDERWRLHP